MATTEDHIAQSDHNVEVSRQFPELQYWDGAVTTLFYSAMHLVQAYMTRLGMNIRNHAHRERTMRMSPELLAIVGPYLLLKDESENARYECLSFTREDYERLRDVHFSSVVDRMRILLGVA